MPSTFTIPNLIELAKWPFPVVRNPHYESVHRASTEWMESYHLLKAEALDAFNRCDFPLVMSLTNPYVTEEHLRIAADICQWFFLYDEFSDVMDGVGTKALSDTLVLSMRNPFDPLPAGSHKLGELTQDLWRRIIKFSVPSSALRLRRSLEEYTDAVCIEANDRDDLHIRGIHEYIEIRRSSAATKAIFHICSLHVEIPEEIMAHPKIQKLTLHGMDLVCIHNDLYSYNFERKHGIHGHNLITAVMKENSLSVQGAFDYCGEMFARIGKDFVKRLDSVPQFSPEIDKVLSAHTLGMGHWIIGIEEWSFRSERYFGKKRLVVEKTRTVELAPEPLRRQYDLQMVPVKKSEQVSNVERFLNILGISSANFMAKALVLIVVYHSFSWLNYRIRSY